MKTEKSQKEGLFEGKGFGRSRYVPLQPENYPPKYEQYIAEEKELLESELRGADAILDAGAGIGRLIPEISPIVREYIGIDNSDFMLEESRKIASTHPNASIRRGEIESLSDQFPEGSFDYSLCLWNTLGNLDNEVVALKELAKISKKNIYVTVHLKGRLEDRKKWYQSVGITPSRIDEKDEVFYFEGGLKSRSYSLNNLEKIAAQSGLRIVESRILGDVVLYVKLGHEDGTN